MEGQLVSAELAASVTSVSMVEEGVVGYADCGLVAFSVLVQTLVEILALAPVLR